MLEKLEIGVDEFLLYREGTTDLNCIIEVFQRKEYQSKKNGFIFEQGSQEGKLWMDCGANIGAFTKLVEMCGGNCISLEPIKENFDILVKNVKNSQCINTAVTAKEDDFLPFFTASKSTDKYRFTTIENSRPVGEFPNICMKEFLDIKFHGVKWDIEGAELEIIDEELIPDCRMLVMEYHFSKDRNMANFHRRIGVLKKHFKNVYYQPFLNKYDLDKPYPLPVDKMIHCVK